MDFGVTDKLAEYYLKSQIGKNLSANQNGISDFAEQLSTARSAVASGVSAGETSKNIYYMGESFEERLSKISDPTAANAFREAYALKMAGSTDYISTLSKAYSTGKVGATTFEDAFSQYQVITHVGNVDVASSTWQRNDFPFWKYFQPNVSADALNDWKPTGANPPQTRSDLQRNYSSIGPGKIAVLMPDSLKEKMDADPAYAQQIVAKLQQWKEDYDRWDNTVAAGYGYNVAEFQAGKSYVFNLDENGDVKNCTVTGAGTITGPTKEEQEQFEAEQAAKRKRMAEHTKMLEESSLKRAQEEKEAIIKYYVNAMVKGSMLTSTFGDSFMGTASNFSLTQFMLSQLL